jgi:hypothetical protein
MISPNLLDYEILLLLAKYGEKETVCALARNLGLPPDEIERRFQRLKELKPKTPSRKRADPRKAVESLIQEHPEKADHLETLLQRFENKTFLPELRDVRRFFHQHSRDLVNIRSRDVAMLSLFRLLASLDLAEIADLAREPEGTEYSSLGILSEEIMRRGG